LARFAKGIRCLISEGWGWVSTNNSLAQIPLVFLVPLVPSSSMSRKS
jgi:hypothetical protein